MTQAIFIFCALQDADVTRCVAGLHGWFDDLVLRVIDMTMRAR